MKAKTIFQKQIIALSKKLPPMSDAQRNWAYQHCTEPIAHRTKKGTTTCLECGYAWTDQASTAETAICPHCGIKLAVSTTRQRVFKQTRYLCTVNTFQGYQLLRFYYMDVYRKIGQPANYSCTEVVQRWIATNGKVATLALLRPMFSWQDTWQWSSNLELRPEKELYDIMPSAVYPRMKVLPQIKRNGFNGEFHDLTPFEMLHTILTDNRAETLLKAGQINVLRYFVRSQTSITEDFWASLKICTRNHYIIKNASMWCDYINILKFLHKDVQNAKYVCPQDLKTEHDRMMKKKEEIRERERLEQQRKKAQEDEKRFQELKAKFFDLAFTDGVIQVKVIESVNDYFEEGKILHHCVFESEYYLKPDSLIFSASINNKRIETVEVSLKKMKVIQSYGVCNKKSEYHEQIIQLVNKNKNIIRKRMVK